jgi:hypothetical protein
VVIEKSIQNFRSHAKICLPKACDGFGQVDQAPLGSFVENRKRSEHRDVSAARLVIGFRLIDHQRDMKFFG